MRWKMFIHCVITAVKENVPFDEKAFDEEVKAFEWQWVQKDKRFSHEPSGDAVKISERLYNRYRNEMQSG